MDTKETNATKEVSTTSTTQKDSDVLADVEGGADDDDAEFLWDEYLQETDAEAAPHTSFMHVEQSLQSCFTEGMKLEVPNKQCPDTYWVASVVMTCGQLLRLRYEGYEEDRSSDFWCDIATSEVHPVGWCSQNGKTLSPPPALSNKYTNWSEFLAKCLAGATLVPAYLLAANGTTPVDLIKQGMKLEVQEKLNPTCVWIATVLENVGGRLLLRYEGANPSDDFWLFYLSYNLHPVGWATSNKFKYKPPEVISLKRSTEAWTAILQQAMEEAVKMPILQDIFKNQENLQPHGFKEGMKLEAVHPTTLVQIYPATVTRILSPYFFVVQIDDHSVVDHQPQAMCCHAESPLIFVTNWAKSRGLSVMHPKGWLNYRQEFDWADYLTYCKAEAAPEDLFRFKADPFGFEKGMKLEAVNPFQRNQICAATITKIVEHLLWVQLDSIDSFHPSHIVPVTSDDIFPVGWCESNRYPLKPPLNTQQGKGRVMKKVAILLQDKQKKVEKTEIASDAKAWCPTIFFNHRCFSGPYLSKGRIAELPRDVGPGPVTLVLKEVLSKLINVAYKSSKVLQELQLKEKPSVNMQQCVLKAKYKGKCYRGIVEVLRNSEKVEDFCRKICIKLECCPYLFGPKYVGDSCPDHCSKLTKTKYTNPYGKKKKKVGRPSLAESVANASAKPGRKRGRKRKVDVEAKELSEKHSDSSQQSGVTNGNKDGSESDRALLDEDGRQKRKYNKYIPPKSDIVTRGAKLPNFAIELHWRRRRKTSPTSSEIGYTPSPRSRASSEDNSKEPSEVCPSEALFEGKGPCSPLQDLFVIPEELRLDTNPLHWSVEEVIKFIKETDCAQLARLLKDQDIDGQALLLLTLPTVQEHLELKLGPAVKLCHQVERVKLAFYSQYAK